MPSLRRAYDRWQIINKVNGDFIARAAIGLFYFTVCALFAIGAVLAGWLRPGIDPLKRKQPGAWIDRQPGKTTLNDARRQF